MRNYRRLRRLRRFLPYPLIAAGLLWLRPVEPMGSDAADQALDLAGLVLAFAGQGLRFWTWGANAEAGLFAVRTNGPYALLRHPLYAGNLLILCGVLLILNNPVAYLLGIPSFVLLYNVIARKEEQQLLPSPGLGAPYRAYMIAHRNRFLPQLERWRTAVSPAHRFDWWFAAEKEYESVLGILLGWITLDLYEELLVWRAASHGSRLLSLQLALFLMLALAAPILYALKKRRSKPGPPARDGAGDAHPAAPATGDP
jgi:protein-S-isoprenylcysteine O-methyltransferase Ste14